MHNNRLKDRQTRRKDCSNIYALGYLCLTFAEFRTESAECPRGHTRTAARLYADYPRGRLRKKLSTVAVAAAND